MNFKPASPFWREARCYCLHCSNRANWVEVQLTGFQKDNKSYYGVKCGVCKNEIEIETDKVFMKDDFRINGPQHISFGFFGKK